MSPPARRLVVVADVGGASFHVGDEAMLAANVAELRARAPAVEITVVGRASAGARLADALAALDGAEALLAAAVGELAGRVEALTARLDAPERDDERAAAAEPPVPRRPVLLRTRP